MSINLAYPSERRNREQICSDTFGIKRASDKGSIRRQKCLGQGEEQS